MEKSPMLIATGKLTQQSLAGRVTLVTGAGGGIGYEAARALLWMGSRVIVAEIDPRTGKAAAEKLNSESGKGSTIFVQTDVGDERSVIRLAAEANRAFGKVDIVINNATIAPLGAVTELPITDWDASYRVNLRGPVLLARAFLPGMITRRYGVFACISSVGMGYMAAYESVKAAQVHLANTLTAELEGTGVSAFTIGPGFVHTQTAHSAIPRLAKLMGKNPEEVFAAVKGATLSVEAAGAGFAAAVVMAERYVGMEISASMALIDAGIDVIGKPIEAEELSPEALAEIQVAAQRVFATLAEQSADWKRRSIFEQQWLARSFKQHAGRPVDQWLDLLKKMIDCTAQGDAAGVLALRAPLGQLGKFYFQLGESAKGFIKDPVQREEHLAIVNGWVEECRRLEALIKK
ncbi:MAG TPA: SDR family oxidoreductase [Anaerolineaceae bacterium]|nr:SDR family oxidoreductase [Anaerolineaceae bacterium]